MLRDVLFELKNEEKIAPNFIANQFGVNAYGVPQDDAEEIEEYVETMGLGSHTDDNLDEGPIHVLTLGAGARVT